jgi:U32 family peptidase
MLPELLAPAGDWDCVKAAVENGADAVYFGLERFNARMRAENFTAEDLPDLMAFLHRRGVKGYLTFNTLIFADELAAAEDFLRQMISAGVDAAIVQDLGLCRLIRHLSPDFPIHASTQMTITSAVGVEFARSLGCQLVVLARECSIADIHKIQQQLDTHGMSMPLEVFVHGALCVAYSGQCLTSEALGGRSANRGECAQACRMPYDLIVDGEKLDLGDRKYLLSPQDLAGLEVLPDLIEAGVSCFKIEGRLKQPEYVASVTQVYRQAIDRAIANAPAPVSDRDRYSLEMAFSRGLYTGWFQGIHNQELVHARFGKKRGVYLGKIDRILDGKEKGLVLQLQAPLRPGDGVVIDQGHPEQKEMGGRVYAVEERGNQALIVFGRQDLDLRKVHVGDRVWKTSDPELDRHIRQSFTGEHPQFRRSLSMGVYGACDRPLTVIAQDEQGHQIQLESSIPLVAAHTQGLTTATLRDQFGRLGNTPFRLGTLENHLEGAVMLPISELNRLRRELVVQLENLRSQPRHWQIRASNSYQDLLPPHAAMNAQAPNLIVLVRNPEQLQVAIEQEIATLYCELENPAHYRRVVQQVRAAQVPGQTIWVAPPRITKPKENYILKQVRDSQADGYLVRNYDQLQYFAGDRCIGDFALNIANPLTASFLKQTFQLERLTASYDLNIQQLSVLFQSAPANWFEVTLHQHMPMFHMEHCVFCAFLSDGTDFTNCGRPCEQVEVKLRDRVGTDHVLQADAGCRNTVFNGIAQTGAEHFQHLRSLGLRHVRIEFLQESPTQVRETIQSYQQLLANHMTGTQLWKALNVQNQLGVTRGSLA